MMGVDVETAVSKIVSLGVDAVGFNCGTATLDEYIELAKKFVSAVEALEKTWGTSHACPERSRGESRVTILAEPNAGKPELVEGKAVYKSLSLINNNTLEPIPQKSSCTITAFF